MCQAIDMATDVTGSRQQPGRFSDRVGYLLKQVDSVLRARMDDVLRPLGLTVPQYACLELLGAEPGLSGAELARGAFVSRQAMNLVVKGLQDRDLITRPDTAPSGRSRPIELTPAGDTLLRTAAARVIQVETIMVSLLSDRRLQQLRSGLESCVTALENLPQRPPNSGTVPGA